jgi:hypothetical protein
MASELELAGGLEPPTCRLQVTLPAIHEPEMRRSIAYNDPRV